MKSKETINSSPLVASEWTICVSSDEQISRAITAPEVEDKIGAFGNAVHGVGKSRVRDHVVQQLDRYLPSSTQAKSSRYKNET